MKRVLIDVDDVTGQFRRAAIELANQMFGLNVDISQCVAWNVEEMFPTLTEDQIVQLWEKICGPGWGQTLLPMPGAVEAIDRIARKYQVAFVTKPLKLSPTWCYDRRLWIAKYFGEVLANSVHNTSMKYAVDGNYLIEDTISHLVEWLRDRKEHSRRDFKAIIYAWPYNEAHPIETQYHVRLPDWPSIEDYLEC